MADMIRLAIQTDSTRFVSFHLGGSGGVVPIDGVDEGYHSLSHHGLDEENLEQLAIVEAAIIASWGDFIRSLNETDDQGQSLLDQTSALLTSNLGNASNHSNKNYPLPNLFVSVMQKMGLESDQFASGTSTMTGL